MHLHPRAVSMLRFTLECVSNKRRILMVEQVHNRYSEASGRCSASIISVVATEMSVRHANTGSGDPGLFISSLLVSRRRQLRREAGPRLVPDG